MKINTNIPALKVLKQLNANDTALSKSLERLSSGKRINHSSDDASGLAISKKMQVQINALSIAKRNANDGISLIQTAEGALNEVHSILQRARELSVQASNGTLSVEDANAVQAEINSLNAELDRVASSIDYNGMTLLDGSINVKSYIAPESEKIAKVVSIEDGVSNGKYNFYVEKSATKTTGIGSEVTAFETDGCDYQGTISINGQTVKVSKGDTSEEVFEKIRDAAEVTGVNVTATSPVFGNGDKIIFEHSVAGEQDISVIGDKDLMAKLGLSTLNFDDTNVHTNTWVPTDVSTGGTIIEDETYYINGVSVVLNTGDDAETVVGKLQALNIPGASFSFDAATGITIDSITPLNIEPSGNLRTAEMKNSLNHIYQTTWNNSSDFPSTAKEIVRVNGYPIQLEVGDTLSQLGSKLSAANIPGATFSYAGSTLTIKSDMPLKIEREADTTNKVAELMKTELVASMGDLAASTSASYKLVSGGKGRDAEVKLGNIDGSISGIDDLSTAIVEGFPSGTTVTTEGNKIKFTAAKNFEIVVENDGKVGEVEMYILKAGELDLQIGANEGQNMSIRIQSTSVKALGLENINVRTATLANEAISKYDNAIKKISDIRSRLGAFQNRLEYTVNSIDDSSESLTASLSRIADTDMAEEISNYTQLNVLSQASMSILAQANQRPEAILQLINK